jgi:hypothetical protein
VNVKPLFNNTEQSSSTEATTPKRVVPLFPENSPANIYTPETTNDLPHPKVYKPAPMFAEATAAAHVDPKAPIAPVVLNLPGVRMRKRWEPTVEDLVKLIPRGSDDTTQVLVRAQSTIRETNTDTDTFEDWGLVYQEQYADRSTQMLQLAMSPVVVRTVEETKSLLGLIEADISRWRHIGCDPTTLLATASRLRRSIEDCEPVRCDLIRMGMALSTLASDLTASQVAGMYFLTVIPVSSSHDTLERRVDSIAVSILGLRQMQHQAILLKNTMTYRTQVVIDVLVNMVPAWCNNRNMKNNAMTSTIIQKLKGAL